jgi:hypothetical protein
MSREAAAAGGSSSSSGRPTTDELLARALLLVLRMLASDETRVTAVANAALSAVAAALGEGVDQLVLGRSLVLHGLSQLLQQPGGPGVLQQMESQLQVGASTLQPHVHWPDCVLHVGAEGTAVTSSVICCDTDFICFRRQQVYACRT